MIYFHTGSSMFNHKRFACFFTVLYLQSFANRDGKLYKNLLYADRDFNPTISALNPLRDRTYETLIDFSHFDARYHFLKTNRRRYNQRDRLLRPSQCSFQQWLSTFAFAVRPRDRQTDNIRSKVATGLHSIGLLIS